LPAKYENRNYNRGYYSDKNSKSTNATNTSDSDSNGSNQVSVLSGFKIVHNGRTLHDETYEDADTCFEIEEPILGLLCHSSKSKFASSELTMAPSFKNISIPLFLQA